MIKDRAGLLGAAAAGIALGVAVGLLVATGSGRRTRRRIARALGDGRDAVLRSSNYLIDRSRRVVNG